MPIYEYKCKVCEQRFEVEQSFTDDTLTTIDGCSIDESRHHQVKKVFAAPAITFKGDGFYRNDSRSSNGDSKSAASTESAPKRSSSASTSDGSSSSPGNDGTAAASSPSSTSSTGSGSDD